MRRLGLDVYLISGGTRSSEQPSGKHFIQLPPLRASNYKFEQLIDDSGKHIDNAWKEARCQLLLEHFRQLTPNIVIIESFPFGRRQLRFELMPLLEAIRKSGPRPLVLSSVRDIVQKKPQHRMTECVEVIQHYFDRIMVHGDPTFIRFEDSFSCINGIEQRLHYTGYVSQFPYNTEGSAGRDEVLVSAGGGAVSGRLLETALQARSESQLKDSTWRFLIGPNIPEPTAAFLQTQTTDGIIVEPNRNDFLTLLHNCAVAVSQAGYNTITDVLLSGARAVVVPFEGDGETEQKQRAQKLQDFRLAHMVSEGELSATKLAEAIDQCATRTRTRDQAFDLDGANGTAKFVLDSWRQHAKDIEHS